MAAGLAPISIGTETEGSLISPASLAALYTIRATPKIISQAGIVPISDMFDTAGPMTKSVEDLANLMDAIVDPNMTTIRHGGYVSAMTKSWSNLKIGALDPSDWLNVESILEPVTETVHQMVNGCLSCILGSYLHC